MQRARLGRALFLLAEIEPPEVEPDIAAEQSCDWLR
jgi:hypothetical protein